MVEGLMVLTDRKLSCRQLEYLLCIVDFVPLPDDKKVGYSLFFLVVVTNFNSNLTVLLFCPIYHRDFCWHLILIIIVKYYCSHYNYLHGHL